MKTYIAYIEGFRTGTPDQWRWVSVPHKKFAAAAAALDTMRCLAPTLSHVTIERYGVTTAPPAEGS